jgi:hypothetical protein
MTRQKKIIRTAQRMYAERSDNDLEILDNALVTRSGRSGFWVAASVYVSNEDISNQTKVEDCRPNGNRAP